MKKLDIILWSVIAGLVSISLGTIAVCIWVLDSWAARIGLIMGVGTVLIFVFYGTVFWLAAKANSLHLKTKESSEP